MDRRQEQEHGSKYQKDLERERQLGGVSEDWIYDDDGNGYRMPYRMIKKVTFSNVDRKELIDPQHAARLQYRLSLLEPVIKAQVNYAKAKISVIYNPAGAQNRREQMSMQELIGALAKEGVHVDPSAIEERDYDYLKEFYSYAYFSPTIREHPPYGYTREEWERMKGDYYKKAEQYNREKLDKFHAWQDEYMASIQEAKGQTVSAAKRTLADKVLGRNRGPKSKKNEKGFWFHGV